MKKNYYSPSKTEFARARLQNFRVFFPLGLKQISKRTKKKDGRGKNSTPTVHFLYLYNGCVLEQYNGSVQ